MSDFFFLFGILSVVIAGVVVFVCRNLNAKSWVEDIYDKRYAQIRKRISED